jgi:hypothetical protein
MCGLCAGNSSLIAPGERGSASFLDELPAYANRFLCSVVPSFEAPAFDVSACRAKAGGRVRGREQLESLTQEGPTTHRRPFRGENGHQAAYDELSAGPKRVPVWCRS